MFKHLKNKSVVIKLLIITILTTIIVTTITLSKYKTTTATDSNARVAFPVLNINSDKVLQIKISPNSSEKKYYFSVSNNSTDKVSEVSMQYNIQIDTLNNLPLIFEIYTYEDGNQGETNLLEGRGNTTDNIIMNLLPEETIHNYVLIVKWNTQYKDYMYSKTLDYITININGAQKN